MYIQRRKREKNGKFIEMVSVVIFLSTEVPSVMTLKTESIFFPYFLYAKEPKTEIKARNAGKSERDDKKKNFTWTCLLATYVIRVTAK